MRWFEVATTLVVSHCKWNHEQTMHCCRLVSHSTHQPFCRMWLVACSLSVSFISVTEATTCLQLSLLLFCANVSCAKCRVCLFAFGAGGIEPAGKCHCVCEGWYCSPEEPDQAAQKWWNHKQQSTDHETARHTGCCCFRRTKELWGTYAHVYVYTVCLFAHMYMYICNVLTQAQVKRRGGPMVSFLSPRCSSPTSTEISTQTIQNWQLSWRSRWQLWWACSSRVYCRQPCCVFY